jgi:hypothetical protein
MKRPAKPRATTTTGDIWRDFSKAQLEGIGAVAVAYNSAEMLIDLMLAVALDLKGSIVAHLTSRINGVDGKIELLKQALIAMGAPKPLLDGLGEVTGDGHFGLLKGYRDQIIHARMTNPEHAIGVSPPKRGKVSDILLSEDALNGVALRLSILTDELAQFTRATILLQKYHNFCREMSLLETASTEKDTIRSAISHRKQADELDALTYLSQAQLHRNRRQSLPPLPQFPPES